MSESTVYGAEELVRSDEGSPPWLSYKKGSKTANGETIDEIVYGGPNCVVYVNEKGDIGFDGDDLRDAHLTAGEAQDLAQELEIILPSEHKKYKFERIKARALIAQCMARALSCRKSDDSIDYFAPAKTYLTFRRLEALQGAHLTAAAVGVLLGCLLLLPVVLPWGLQADVKPFFAAFACGSLGAFISVAQRFRTIDFGRFAERKRAREEGWLRVLLGAIFGVVLVLLQKAGLLLELADGIYRVAAFALAAGFSERLIPELLGRVEGSLNQPERN